MRRDRYIDRARFLGSIAGKNAASWAFDGRTDDATYARVLRGIEDCDPEILDSLRPPTLSGEWAGEPVPADILAEVYSDPARVSPDRQDDILRAWEDAASEAYMASVEAECRANVA